MKNEPFRYFALNKPFGVLSQFTAENNHPGIAALKLGFPKDVWPIGRLDRDSEGLILLTNDIRMRSELTEPKNNHTKHYWAQVEGVWTESASNILRNPMVIRVKGKEIDLRPADARSIETPEVWERVPPIRFRQSVPTSWVAISISEGKNRQVRKMTAQAGFPTLRLIRHQIGRLSLEKLGLSVGSSQELTPEQMQMALL